MSRSTIVGNIPFFFKVGPTTLSKATAKYKHTTQHVHDNNPYETPEAFSDGRCFPRSKKKASGVRHCIPNRRPSQLTPDTTLEVLSLEPKRSFFRPCLARDRKKTCKFEINEKRRGQKEREKKEQMK
ncbi:hypothetical protein CEXT_439701 [Caerostris extrusa]|uniref:Uncharacterized protein n=1 Tax=Caerostris extrusa TaxID=172846 RepID=A0AAV4SEH8_CAEEX|nr:hypothetical protein CEXT_439701 [Caerostris extrusa]